MGTSQSVNPSVKNNPNWGDLSRAVLSASHSDHITNSQLNGIMRHFVSAVGGQGAGHGRSSTFGRAGIKRAQRFMSFVSDINNVGLNGALSNIGVNDTTNLSINDFINFLLIYCIEGDSNLDDTAANSATDELLKHILNNVESVEDIEQIFQHADIETQNEWLCFYFASYIMEFSSELFSTRIFENEGDRVRTFQQIRTYIQNSLLEVKIDRGLQNIDWKGDQGKSIIKKLQTEILEIWSQE